MRNLMRRGKAEPATLNVPEPDSSIIEAANTTIAGLRDDLDDRAEQIAGLRDRCDDLFATVRRKDEQIAELRAEARTSEALIETLRAGLAEAAGENATLREALAGYRPVPEQEAVGKVMADVGYLDGLTERAERAERRIAAAVTALRPLAKLKGPTVADRARVTSQVIVGLEADGPGEQATP